MCLGRNGPVGLDELQLSGTTCYSHVLAVYCNTCQSKIKKEGKKPLKTPNLTVKRLMHSSKKKNEFERTWVSSWRKEILHTVMSMPPQELLKVLVFRGWEELQGRRTGFYSLFLRMFQKAAVRKEDPCSESGCVYILKSPH